MKENKEKKKRRRLVKEGRLVDEEDLPPAYVVEVEEKEVNEELASLFRKSSKKFVIMKSKKGSSVKGIEIENETSVE